MAINAQPERKNLRPEATYPNKRQYPIKLEAKEELQSLVDKFLKHWLLVTCQSPCNTPIFPAIKSTEEYWVIQDLRAVNDAVVP